MSGIQKSLPTWITDDHGEIWEKTLSNTQLESIFTLTRILSLHRSNVTIFYQFALSRQYRRRAVHRLPNCSNLSSSQHTCQSNAPRISTSLAQPTPFQYRTTTHFDIESVPVLFMVTKVIENHKILSSADQAAFHNAKRGEIDYLLKGAVKLILSNDVGVQSLKWVLSKKATTDRVKKIRHRARIFVTSHHFPLRHTVHGIALTLTLGTLRIFVPIVPAWM